MSELRKIDPKCWTCGCVNIPQVQRYGPNICSICLPEYRERKFVFVRASAQEIEELFGGKVNE